MFRQSIGASLHWVQVSARTEYKYLFGNLAKVVDEADDGCFLERVLNTVDVDVALVEEIVKDVDALDGARALLLLAEYQVNPLVQVRADVVTLQRLSISAIMSRPGEWHTNIAIEAKDQAREQRIAKRRCREARYDAPRDGLE